MIPSFPNRLTGPAPAGGGTGILLRRAGQGPAGGGRDLDLPPLWRKFPFSSPPDYCIIKYGTERACPPCFVLTARGSQGAPGSRPCGRRAQWSRPTSIASAGRAGGHMGPPLRKIRSVIRHCEEGRRPDVAIRTFMQGERIPTAPPGPRNDGVGAQGAPQAAKGRLMKNHRPVAGGAPSSGPSGHRPPREKVQTARPGGRALQGCATRRPPHHGGATGEARLSG